MLPDFAFPVLTTGYDRPMISKDLLDILCCPETKEEVALADAALIERINVKIAAGSLKNRGGQSVTEKIDTGLLRKDGKYLYPIREDIPIMLIDEALPMDQTSLSQETS